MEELLANADAKGFVTNVDKHVVAAVEGAERYAPANWGGFLNDVSGPLPLF